MLRDRLVWGIHDDKMQVKLLQEKDLTFEKALTIARGYKTADKNLKEMKAPKVSDSMHTISGRKPTSTSESGLVCHCCGTPGHKVNVCQFRDCVCHKCKRRGHLARVCLSKSALQPQLPKEPERGGASVRPLSDCRPTQRNKLVYWALLMYRVCMRASQLNYPGGCERSGTNTLRKILARTNKTKL